MTMGVNEIFILSSFLLIKSSNIFSSSLFETPGSIIALSLVISSHSTIVFSANRLNVKTLI
jgi:hypothetical protein